MSQKSDIGNLFKEDKQIDFDFSQAPTLIKSRIDSKTSPKISKKNALSQWKKSQNSFYNCTRDKRVFTKEYTEATKLAYDALFKNAGPLKGKILDIGGGWGLYRQWWQPGKSDVFVVHDPGIQRFLDGPHQSHYQYFQQAFSLPMTFVEGFGEDLPYKNHSFDTCLIAATLDHCLYPQKVCAEAHRCLKPGGTILLIQSCYSSHMDTAVTYLRGFAKHLRHPSYITAFFYNRLFQTSHHLHRFSKSEIVLLLEQVSFSQIHMHEIPTLENIYAFLGVK